MSKKSSSSNLPKNWPNTGVQYIVTQEFSSKLDSVQLGALRTRPSKYAQDIPTTAKGPNPLVKIIPITKLSHPACGQSGLFAAKDLKPGTFVLQYLGEVHGSPPVVSLEVDPHASSDYDLSLDRDYGLGIDADMKGNEARFINDYRGVGEKPNAEFKEVWDVGRGERGMAVWVMAEGKNTKWKGIKKGEEILVSYGRGFWGARKDDAV